MWFLFAKILTAFFVSIIMFVLSSYIIREWNFDSLKSQKRFLQPTITMLTIYDYLCCVLIYAFITK